MDDVDRRRNRLDRKSATARGLGTQGDAAQMKEPMATGRRTGARPSAATSSVVIGTVTNPTITPLACLNVERIWRTITGTEAATYACVNGGLQGWGPERLGDWENGAQR